jgi:hypothetical protein
MKMPEIKKVRYFKFPCGFEIHIEGYECDMIYKCPMHGCSCGTKNIKENPVMIPLQHNPIPNPTNRQYF